MVRVSPHANQIICLGQERDRFYTFLFITKESFLQEAVIGRRSKPSAIVHVGNVEDVENMLASECDFVHVCRKNKHLHVLCNETVP